MSAGHAHKNPNLKHAAELHDLMQDPAVAAELAKPYRVDEQYDIPYLAGYSKDGATIYIDRSLAAARPSIGDVPYESWRFALESHEHLEKVLIDQKQYDYQAAHEFATVGEHEVVRSLGLRTVAYERALKPFIATDATKQIENPPPDLDLTPYEDEGDVEMLDKLRGANGGSSAANR